MVAEREKLMNEESLHWLGIFNNFAISNNNGVDRLEFSGLTGNPSPFPLCDYLRSTQVFDSQSLFLTKQGGEMETENWE